MSILFDFANMNGGGQLVFKISNNILSVKASDGKFVFKSVYAIDGDLDSVKEKAITEIAEVFGLNERGEKKPRSATSHPAAGAPVSGTARTPKRRRPPTQIELDAAKPVPVGAPSLQASLFDCDFTPRAITNDGPPGHSEEHPADDTQTGREEDAPGGDSGQTESRVLIVPVSMDERLEKALNYIVPQRFGAASGKTLGKLTEVLGMEKAIDKLRFFAYQYRGPEVELKNASRAVLDFIQEHKAANAS